MNAAGYNSRKDFLLNEGLILIDKLNNDFNDRPIKTLLEIGCGTGIVTFHLSQILTKVKNIYGVDNTEELIEFAQHNNNAKNIQYFTQDLSMEWNQLRPELKAMEDKIDIIFSNYGFQWMYTKKNNLIKNISRLLTSGGRVYANINYIPSPFKKLEENDQGGWLKYLAGKLPEIPSQEEQVIDWTESFLRSEFEIFDYYDNDCTYTFDLDQFDKNFVPMSVILLQQFYGFFYLSKVTLFLMKYLRLKTSKNMKKLHDHNTGQTLVVVNYQNGTYVLIRK